MIAEFSSPLKAAEAAVATQLKMKTMNQDKAESDQMIFRVGINIGDVMVTDNNLFGDAVNLHVSGLHLSDGLWMLLFLFDSLALGSPRFSNLLLMSLTSAIFLMIL